MNFISNMFLVILNNLVWVTTVTELKIKYMIFATFQTYV